MSAIRTAFADTTGELDPRFSGPDASPTPWEDIQAVLEEADRSWITTVRDDRRPHSTPLVAVWFADAI